MSDFKVTAINKKRAVVNGQRWPYLSESSRFVYASPCGKYVLKADGFNTDDPSTPETLSDGDFYGRQSVSEALGWEAIKNHPRIAKWFLPVVASGVLSRYLPPTAVRRGNWGYRTWAGGKFYRSWVIQKRSYGINAVRNYDPLPKHIQEAHTMGFTLMANALGVSYYGTDGTHQYDDQNRIYDYGL